MPLPEVDGIPYAHTVKYFSKGFDGSSPYYAVQYRIDNWSDSDDFANALLGIGQVAPHAHPLAPNFIASMPVTVEGVGSPVLNEEGLPDYSKGALVTLTYRPAGQFGVIEPSAPAGQPEQVFDPSSPPVLWATEDMDYGMETGTVPDASFLWESDDAVAKVPLKYDLSIITMTLTFHRVRLIPTALINECHGKVNGPGDAITSPGLILPANPSGVFFGASRGTIRFQGPKTNRSFSSDGTVERRMTMVFVKREKPWGQYLRNNKFEWDYLKDTDDNRQFEEIDLRPLIYFSQLT